MTKTSIFSVVLATALASSFASAASADSANAKKVRFGLGAAFGTEIETLGFQAKAIVPLNIGQLRFGIVPSINVFLPHSEGGVDVNLLELNGDMHYYFNDVKPQWYVGGGVNISRWSADFDGNNGIGNDYSETDLGINAMGGLLTSLNSKIPLALEARYTIADGDQFVFSATAFFF